MSVPVVTGTPVATENVPVGRPVAASEAAADLERVKARFREELREIERRERRAFLSSLDLATGVAQARVGESVQASIASRLPGALREHLRDTDATRRLVAEVSVELQRRVEADAAGVVARLASRESAEHALSRALEAQCLARVDEKMGGLWRAYFLGGALTAAAGGLLAWSLGGGSRRERR